MSHYVAATRLCFNIYSSNISQYSIYSLMEVRKCSTVSGIKDCITARPPMDMDLQGPTVYSYNIPKDKPDMTSFPAYTFGSKTEPDRGYSSHSLLSIFFKFCFLRIC